MFFCAISNTFRYVILPTVIKRKMKGIQLNPVYELANFAKYFIQNMDLKDNFRRFIAPSEVLDSGMVNSLYRFRI